MVAILFMLCPPVQAQRASVLVSTSFSEAGSLGFERSFTFGVSPELESRYVLLRAQPFLRTANKVNTGDGTSYGLRLEGYGRFRRLLFGAGASHTQLNTSRYEKSATRPFLGGGIEGTAGGVGIRALGQYYLSGTDRTNHLHGPRFQVDLDLNPRFRLTFETAVYRFHPSNRPDLGNQTGFLIGTGIAFRLFDSSPPAPRR
jgi:hypothetical protein